MDSNDIIVQKYVFVLTRKAPVDALEDEQHKVRVTNRFLETTRRGKKLCNSLFMWTRIIALIFTIFLFLLALSFTVAQLVETSLDIVSRCPEPKSLEEIWAHNLQKAEVDGDGVVQINVAAQKGWHIDPCWNRIHLQFNDGMWRANLVIHDIVFRSDWGFYLFAASSLFLLSVVVYNAFTIITDINSALRGTLHQKAQAAQPLVGGAGAAQQISFIHSIKSTIKSRFGKMFLLDTTGWILVKFLTEIVEFTIQSKALFEYNGYSWTDPDGAYTAKKPDAIISFAVIIAFNCFGSGLMWSLYALFPGTCHGLIFQRIIFFVDKVCSLLLVLSYHSSFRASPR